jgi:hypothetical protein
MDPRDAAVARVPASSRVLLLPLSDELEGDGPRAGTACTLKLSPCCFVRFFFVVSPCCNGFFDVATDDFLMLQ